MRVAGPEPEAQPKASLSVLFVLEDCSECSETEERDAQAEKAFGLLLEVVEDLKDGHADEMDVGLVDRDDGDWEREEVDVDGAVVCVQRREHGDRARGRWGLEGRGGQRLRSEEETAALQTGEKRFDEPATYRLGLWLASLRLDSRDEERGVQETGDGGRKEVQESLLWPRLGRLSVGRPLRPWSRHFSSAILPFDPILS